MSFCHRKIYHFSKSSYLAFQTILYLLHSAKHLLLVAKEAHFQFLAKHMRTSSSSLRELASTFIYAAVSNSLSTFPWVFRGLLVLLVELKAESMGSLVLMLAYLLRGKKLFWVTSSLSSLFVLRSIYEYRWKCEAAVLSNLLLRSLFCSIFLLLYISI